MSQPATTTDPRLGRTHDYAAAFEAAYASDDWMLLEPFFTPDATSELNGARVEGRAAVVDAFRNGVAAFDRRFDSRAMRIVEGPAVDGDAVRIRAVGTYRREGLPALELIGDEWFTFAGDRITRHVDVVVNLAEVMQYLSEYADRLRPMQPR